MTEPTADVPGDLHNLPLPDDLPGSLPPPPPPRRRFYPLAFTLGLLAWCVIVLTVLLAVAAPREAEEQAGEAAANDALNLLTMRAQARYLLGVRELTQSMMGTESQIYSQAQTLNAGPIDQRLRFVILAGELQGPKEALAKLDDLDALIARKEPALTKKQQPQQAILRKLYTDYRHLHYDAPSLTPSDRQLLHNQMGWFGDLALAPAGQPEVRARVAAVAGGPAAVGIDASCPDPEAREAVLLPAIRVAVTMLSALGSAVFCLLLGLCGLILLAVLMYTGHVRGGLDCGTAPAGVYAETFALWMLGLIGIRQLLDLDELRDLDFGRFRPLVGGLAMLLSLVVLAWPVLRGVPWRQVREDLGLTLGRRPAAEPAVGVGCYVLGFPLMSVGLVVMLILMALQHLGGGGPASDDLTNPATPAHPIVVPLARGDWGLRLQLFFLASFIAPIVEETMFRGVLYRHLRELTHGLRVTFSVLVSCLVSTFIFAVIHPQGLLAVPVLMALACGFVLAREWRGTLIPGMVAHGLNNGLVLMTSIAMLSD